MVRKKKNKRLAKSKKKNKRLTKSQKWQKDLQADLETYHLIRSTPFSFHRVGDIVKPVRLTEEDMKAARREMLKRERIKERWNPSVKKKKKTLPSFWSVR